MDRNPGTPTFHWSTPFFHLRNLVSKILKNTPKTGRRLGQGGLFCQKNKSNQRNLRNQRQKIKKPPKTCKKPRKTLQTCPP